MILYTLLRTLADGGDCECHYCGTFDAIDKAVAHRDHIISGAPDKLLTTRDFVIVRTRCNEAVCLPTCHIPETHDVFAEEKKEAWEGAKATLTTRQKKESSVMRATATRRYLFQNLFC